MHKNIFAALLIISALLLTPINSFSITGLELLETCTDINTNDLSFSHGLCIGYLNAATYSYIDNQDNLNPDMGKICLPKEVNGSQIFNITKKHIENTPKKQHLAAHKLIVESLVKTFPCK